jgi:hypothetical protein
MSDNSALLAFIDQLRGKGIRSFKGPFEEGVIELELGPALIPDPPASPTNAPDASLCNCKCPVYAHTNGLCLAGCEPEACAGSEAVA